LKSERLKEIPKDKIVNIFLKNSNRIWEIIASQHVAVTLLKLTLNNSLRLVMIKIKASAVTLGPIWVRNKT